MKHRKENHRVRTTVAARSQSALPHLLFALAVWLLAGQASAQRAGMSDSVS